MDITPTSTLHPKSLEPELENPTRVHHHPAKHLSFSNGFLKRRHHHHHNDHAPIVITYKECLKNHAANLGGLAVDGCGEFMPSPTTTPTDPTSLKCAACGCHRNFHRRDHDSLPPPPPPPTATTATVEFLPHHRHHPPRPATRSPNSSSPPPISSSYPHMLLSLSTGDITATPATKKRFRTKFSETQKEKMFRFAEKLGWKMQKRDDDLIREFCNEVKVNKGVFKVWMHNNKNTLGKRVLVDSVINGDNPTTTATATATPTTASIANYISISNRSVVVDNGNGDRNSNTSNSNESEDSGEQKQGHKQQFITPEVTNCGFSSS